MSTFLGKQSIYTIQSVQFIDRLPYWTTRNLGSEGPSKDIGQGPECFASITTSSSLTADSDSVGRDAEEVSHAQLEEHVQLIGCGDLVHIVILWHYHHVDGLLIEMFLAGGDTLSFMDILTSRECLFSVSVSKSYWKIRRIREE